MDNLDAVKGGDCEKLQLNAAQVNCVDENGLSLLIVAVQNRTMELLKDLIDRGANVNAVNKEGNSALYLAVKSGRLDIVTLLLDGGANVNWIDNELGQTALALAARRNHLEIATLLLDRGAEVNLPTETGHYPLLCAAYERDDEMVKLLLRHGADVHSISTDQHLCMNGATAKCSYATVITLIDAGANTAHITKIGNTPLTVAKDETMKRLIRTCRAVGGLPWLVRELSARGLEWETICDVQDKLAKESLTTWASFACMPLTQFNHSYLERVGISSLYVRQLLVHIRLQSTWLGARLTQHADMRPECLEVCEHVVLQRYGCASEASFERVLPEELSDESLARLVSIAAPVRRGLREVHAQVCAEKTMSKQTK